MRQPLSQASPLQHGRKALHRRRRTLPRRLYRAISRRSHNQLSALKPVLVPAHPLRRSKELCPRQSLHDLPPMVGWWLGRPRRNSTPDHGHLMAHDDARQRADARGRHGSVREKLAAGIGLPAAPGSPYTGDRVLAGSKPGGWAADRAVQRSYGLIAGFDLWGNSRRTVCYHFATQLGSTGQNKATQDETRPRGNADKSGLFDTGPHGLKHRSPNS